MHHTDHIIPEEPRPLPESGALYFVGIGGAGMSAIAQVLAERGRIIVGADPGISATVKARLEAVGATVFAGHDAAQVGADVSAVVVSDAIPQANPEVIYAKEHGIPIYRRPEVLGAIVNAGRGIAISGTHGKTTTTGMVASILMAAGLDPTVLIGGDLPLIGGNARNGKGRFVVAESCEAYDGFLYLHPEIAVILNIEADHLDYHGTEQHVFDSFKRFIRQVKGEKLRDKGRYKSPTVIACLDDATTFRIVDDASRTIAFSPEYYGIASDGAGASSYFAASKIETVGTGSRFLVSFFTEEFFTVTLQVPGRHNILNALAAICVALKLNIDDEHILAGLESFTGTGRRFERLGEVNGISVIDDYAHHPTELRATLSAARSAFPDRRIVAVFQPHLPSRTRDLMAEFAEALAFGGGVRAQGHSHPSLLAVYLTDIYLAREQPIPGVSSETLSERVAALPGAPPVVYVPNKSDLPARLAADVRPGDVVITLGAGDIRGAGEGLLRLLTAAEAGA